MVKFLLWCILFVLCWPLALLALFLYPLAWILLLPFRLVGIAVDGVSAMRTNIHRGINANVHRAGAFNATKTPRAIETIPAASVT